MTLTPLQKGGLVVLVLIVLYVGYKVMWPNVATGPAGGVAPANSPAVTVPIVTPAIPYTAAILPVPGPVAAKLTKYIVLRKDVTDDILRRGEASFQVGELKVFADGVLLPVSAFASAEYTAGGTHANFPAANLIDGNVATFSHTGNVPTQEITVTLAQPAHVTSVEVYNRTDCCQGRLAGTKVTLQDAGKMILWSSAPLTSADVQTIAPIYTAQGFSSQRCCPCGCPSCTCKRCAKPYHSKFLCPCVCRNCRSN